MLNLISGPYGLLIKFGLGLAVILGLYGGGYYEGYKHQKIIYQAQIVTHVLRQTDALPKEIKLELAQQTVVKTVHDKEIQYVEKDVPTAANCTLGPDAVGLLNSLRGTLSPQPE